MQDYAEIFLERADLLKYRLYALLARPYVQDVSITDLATMLHGKYQPTYNVFQELLADLVELTQLPREDVRSALLAATALPLSLDEYRAYLAQQGLLYRLVDYVVNQPTPSPNQFCEQEFVSRSTISRKLKPFNQLLAHYGVKLRLAHFVFEGNEFNIRACLYTMYWWAHRGASWPFATVARTALEAEFAAVGIGDAQPLAHLQQLYFLAISHLRVGKKARMTASPYLQRFDAMVAKQHLRAGGQRVPLAQPDVAAFNLFQMSQPRFDVQHRAPEAVAQAVTLLTDEVVATVIDTLMAVLYQPAQGELDDDMYLNLLRLIASYTFVQGPVPQAQDYLGGGRDESADAVVALAHQAIAALPQAPAYEPFRQAAAQFAGEIARLAGPYYARNHQEGCVHVRLAMDPLIEGYRELAGFVNCVPWVATIVPQAGDLVIATSDEPPASAPTFTWYADALTLATYRESLISELVRAHGGQAVG